MTKINIKGHCSLNKVIRNLFHKKQKINNSTYYSEEEKKKLIMEIEENIRNKWAEIKLNLE